MSRHPEALPEINQMSKAKTAGEVDEKRIEVMTAQPPTSSQLAYLLQTSSPTSSIGSSDSNFNPNMTTSTTAIKVEQKPTTGLQNPPVTIEATAGGEPIVCYACQQRILDRYLLKAMEKYWHEDCLVCTACKCRLAEAGSSMYYKENMLLCKRDYLRLFGLTGVCAACHTSIPAFEMVMRARHNVYHLECFACQECQHRFCIGDRFYLCENKILCEYDYEERLVFAQMAYNYNGLAQMRRQFQDLDGMDEAQSVATR